MSTREPDLDASMSGVDQGMEDLSSLMEMGSTREDASMDMGAQDLGGEMDQDMEPSPVDMGPPLMFPPQGLIYPGTQPMTLVDSFEVAGTTYTLAANQDPVSTDEPIKFLWFEEGSSTLNQRVYTPSRPFAPTRALVTADGVFVAGYQPETLQINVARLDQDLDEVWATNYRGATIGEPHVELIQVEPNRLLAIAISSSGRDDELLLSYFSSAGQSVAAWIFELLRTGPDMTYSVVDALAHGGRVYALLEETKADGTSAVVLVHRSTELLNIDAEGVKLAAGSSLRPVQLLESDVPDKFLLVAQHDADTIIFELGSTSTSLQTRHVIPDHQASEVVRDATGRLWSTGRTTARGQAALEVGYIQSDEFHALAIQNLLSASSTSLIAMTALPHLLLADNMALLDVPLGPEPSASCSGQSTGTRRVAQVRAQFNATVEMLDVATRFQSTLNRVNIDLQAEPDVQVAGSTLTTHCSP